jgi:hypothetical protein
MTERDRSRGMGPPRVVPVPRPLLAAMPQLPESHLRALLYLLATGAPATLPEIAAGTGIGERRLARALIELSERAWTAEELSGSYRLIVPPERPLTPVPVSVVRAMPEWEPEKLRALLYLLDRAFADRRRDRPAQAAQIAAGTGIGRRRLEPALAQLVNEGWAAREPSGGYLLAQAQSARENGRLGGETVPTCEAAARCLSSP